MTSSDDSDQVVMKGPEGNIMNTRKILRLFQKFLSQPDVRNILESKTGTGARPPRAQRSVSGLHIRRRGRSAGRYLLVQHDKQMRRLTAKIEDVYKALQSAPNGMTQKELQDNLNMSQSTVWYALHKLQNRRVVRYLNPVQVADSHTSATASAQA